MVSFFCGVLTVFLRSSRVAWLHGCTERRCRCASTQVGQGGGDLFGGPGGQLRGWWLASCRTKAGAGLPWPRADAARPERRDGDQGCAGREAEAGAEAEGEKKSDAGVHGP